MEKADSSTGAAAVRPGGAPPAGGPEGSIPAALGGAGAGADAGGRLESSEASALAGADALCGAPVAGPASAPPLPAVSSIKISEPSETLSPTLSLTSATRPAVGDGTSMDAFSVSSVMSGVSFSICWPLFTRTSITSTFLKPPMSGTETSIEFATLSA